MRKPSAALRLSLAACLMTGLAVSVAANASPQSSATSALTARGSVKQVYVTGAPAGSQLTLLDRSGESVDTNRANALGGTVFYGVRPGSGYRVQVGEGATSGPVTVHTAAAKPWDPKVYDQKIADHGYQYLTTRDGTKLAINVWPPTSPAGEGIPQDFTLPEGLPDYAPPYPTLIEYSGYGYANPDGPTNGIAVLANLMGFAVVDVNMRGSGCSGGAFNFFEKLQDLDGYDVIQTIANQPWVKDHKVGMMGISYGGISQLFTAQLNPPALEAISPLSVIDATATTLYPGGIRNDGFAVAWAKERQHEALPAGPDAGQPYAWDRIQGGDQVCKQNQTLHPEAQDLLATIQHNSHYHPRVADPLDPVTFVHKIHVPVFMACQWEDEQTGGHCPTLAAHMTGTDKKWFTFTNGAHIDSLDPATYQRWYDFLSIYVAHQAPMENAAITQAAAPVIYQAAMGLPQYDAVTMPPDPIQRIPTYDEAKSAFEKLPSVRVLFDNGAGRAPTGVQQPGNPYPGFERSFNQWPIANTATKQLFLGPQGTMTSQRPSGHEVDWFNANPHAMPLTDFGPDTGGGGLWGNAAQWEWKWQRNPNGTAIAYESPPLKHDTTVIGAGAVHLWVRASAPDVDLLATISEVHKGDETFVQNGYLRASERKLSHNADNVMHTPSTLLEPVPTMRAGDVRPVPSDRFVKVVIPLYYEGHVYRAGTRIRVTISAPNGTQPIWSFSHTRPGHGATNVSVLLSRKRPSSLVLPVVPVEVPTMQPPCPALRNEPCRPYQPVTNPTLDR